MKFRRPVYIIPRYDYPEDVTLCRYMKKLRMVKIIKVPHVIEMPDETQINEMRESIDEKTIKSLEKLHHPIEFILEFIKK